MHHQRLSHPYGERVRKSFQVDGVSIDVEESFKVKGGTRLVERGRGYVKVLVLYDEELRWSQEICRKEQRSPGGYQQLGRIKGGARTLLCTRIRFGVVRKLELRLFAPFGKRQMCIPEMVAGHGWMLFTEILSNFLSRREEEPALQPFSLNSRMEEDTQLRSEWSTQVAPSRMQKSYLQAAVLPKWQAPVLRSSITEGKEKCVLVDYDDAVESSFQLARCLVGRLEESWNGRTEAAAVKKWADWRWKIPGGLEAKEMDSDTFLFIFPSRELAEQRIGKFSINGSS